MRALRRPLLPLLLTALLAAAPLALAATAEPTETYATLLTQIDANKGNPQRVIAATVDKSKHHVRVTLANGTRPLISYPPGDDKHLVDTLLHHNIRVIYAKKPAVHHTLRYVAAAVVVVLLLIGGGVWFYTRGRDADAETDASAATSP
jgi:hypothetical protein